MPETEVALKPRSSAGAHSLSPILHECPPTPRLVLDSSISMYRRRLLDASPVFLRIMRKCLITYKPAKTKTHTLIRLPPGVRMQTPGAFPEQREEGLACRLWAGAQSLGWCRIQAAVFSYLLPGDTLAVWWARSGLPVSLVPVPVSGYCTGPNSPTVSPLGDS